jgi:hypothetical protein
VQVTRVERLRGRVDLAPIDERRPG